MYSRTTKLLAIGVSTLFLTACAGRSVIVETCPPIPEILTEACEPPARDLSTNGELARAYIDAIECVDEATLKLRAIRELSSCRVRAVQK
jgi:uncharacterized lipoprotein YajG